MTAITLEAIKELLQELFTEMFKKHEATMASIISANHKIVNDRLDVLSREIEDVKSSLEFTQNDMDDKVKIIEINAQKNKKELKEIRDIEPGYVQEIRKKVVDLEDRSRRQNLRVDGIKESDNESWEDCQKKVQEMFRTKLNLEETIEIDRAHRSGKRKDNRARTIVLKLKNYEDKTTILKKGNLLKDTGIYINEDFSRETLEYRKTLWDEVKAHRRNGKISYLQYRTVVVRNRPLS